MVIGHERALDGLVGSVVMPDGGGQGEDALQDAGNYPGRGAPAVPLKVELALECLVDRLDDLAQRLEQVGASVVGPAPTGRGPQARTRGGDGRLGGAAVSGTG